MTSQQGMRIASSGPVDAVDPVDVPWVVETKGRIESMSDLELHVAALNDRPQGSTERIGIGYDLTRPPYCGISKCLTYLESR